MIWDSFIFFNEFELLELRLNELDGLVDRYVICEATLTHAGKRKPLHYAEHADDPELRPFRARIVHVVVDDVPVEAPNRWVRALHQRDAISRGWTGCAPDDLILVSDTDEIPRPSAIRLADQRLGSSLDNEDLPPGGIEGRFIRFHMKVYMSWLNAYKNPAGLARWRREQESGEGPGLAMLSAGRGRSASLSVAGSSASETCLLSRMQAGTLPRWEAWSASLRRYGRGSTLSTSGPIYWTRIP